MNCLTNQITCDVYNFLNACPLEGESEEGASSLLPISLGLAAASASAFAVYYISNKFYTSRQPYSQEISEIVLLMEDGCTEWALAKFSALASKIFSDTGNKTLEEKKSLVKKITTAILSQCENDEAKKALFSKIGRVADHPAFPKQFLSQDIKDFFEKLEKEEELFTQNQLVPLREKREVNIQTAKPIFLISPVLNDGFGDLAIAISLLKTYAKKTIGPFHLLIFSTKEHLEKIKTTFQETIEKLPHTLTEFHPLETIHTMPQVLFKKRAENPSSITVVASSGPSFPSLMDFVPDADYFHEIGGGCETLPKTIYSKTSLQIPFGFSPSSAGVLLPAPSKLSLPEILPQFGLLKSDAMTLLYMKNKVAKEVYLEFLNEVASKKKTPIHVIHPTTDPSLLAMGKETKGELISVHYTSLLKPALFDALVQKSTSPPAITGNGSFLHALAASSPFFFDAMQHTAPVIREFADCCRQYSDQIPSSTVEYIETIASISKLIQSGEKQDLEESVTKAKWLGKFFAEHEEAIRDGFTTLRNLIKKHHNAKHLVLNRLAFHHLA